MAALGFSTIVLFPIASIAELIVDPTSHNLWPLEFFIWHVEHTGNSRRVDGFKIENSIHWQVIWRHHSAGLRLSIEL